MNMDALYQLEEIKDQLNALSDDAKNIVSENFPDKSSWASAYDIFNFGGSKNPYDQTFEKLIDNLYKRKDEEDDE